MKHTFLTALTLVTIGGAGLADVVYITARPQPSGGGANPDGTYTELIAGSDTSAASNPFVNLDEPISFRLLLQPVGAAAPVAPPAPTLSINLFSGLPVLNWQGGHRLQSSVDVTGTYTNVPQALTTTTNTYLAPYTNTFTEPTRLFRLVD